MTSPAKFSATPNSSPTVLSEVTAGLAPTTDCLTCRHLLWLACTHDLSVPLAIRLSSLRVISTPPRLRDSTQQASSGSSIRQDRIIRRKVSPPISSLSIVLDSAAHAVSSLNQWMMRRLSYLLFFPHSLAASLPGATTPFALRDLWI
jgi:hypothetical protein